MRRIIFCCLFLFISSANADPLVIGALAYNPPFEIEGNAQGMLFGFEVDIMNEVCKRINRQCQYKLLLYPVLFAQTLSGEVSLSISSIAITEARKKEFIFSLPYLISAARFVTLSKSPINNLSDIQGKKIGILGASTYITMLKNQFSNNQIISLPGEGDVLQGLQNGTVDIAVTDDAIARYWVTNMENIFKLVGKAIPAGEGYGIMANKNNAALIDQINKVLLQMESDGTYKNIYDTYF